MAVLFVLLNGLHVDILLSYKSVLYIQAPLDFEIFVCENLNHIQHTKNKWDVHYSCYIDIMDLYVHCLSVFMTEFYVNVITKITVLLKMYLSTLSSWCFTFSSSTWCSHFHHVSTWLPWSWVCWYLLAGMVACNFLDVLKTYHKWAIFLLAWTAMKINAQNFSAVNITLPKWSIWLACGINILRGTNALFMLGYEWAAAYSAFPLLLCYVSLTLRLLVRLFLLIYPHTWSIVTQSIYVASNIYSKHFSCKQQCSAPGESLTHSIMHLYLYKFLV